MTSISISVVVVASGVQGSGSKSSMGSSLRAVKALWLMVNSLLVGGSGSNFTPGSMNWKAGSIFLLVSDQ